MARKIACVRDAGIAFFVLVHSAAGNPHTTLARVDSLVRWSRSGLNPCETGGQGKDESSPQTGSVDPASAVHAEVAAEDCFGHGLSVIAICTHPAKVLAAAFPYHSAMMVNVLIYGHATGVYSLRRCVPMH